MSQPLLKSLPVLCLLALPACSQNFEQQGDARLVGNWECTPPNVITDDPDLDMTLSIAFRADGTNTVTMDMTSRTIYDEVSGSKFSYDNLYRVDGDKITEKQTSSTVHSYQENGEEITGYARTEYEKYMAEDIGNVDSLKLKFLSDNKIVIDEDTDNVVCERAG